MTIILTIKPMHVSIAELKKNPGKYVRMAAAGKQITICIHNKPMVELKNIAKPTKNKRKIGLAEGKYPPLENFNDPLPEEILNLFYGE